MPRWFFALISLFVLAACAADQSGAQAEPPRLAATATPTETTHPRPTETLPPIDTAVPTVTITASSTRVPRPTQTLQPSLTPDSHPTPGLIALPAPIDARCVQRQEGVVFPEPEQPVGVYTLEPAALDYLNNGGDPAKLEEYVAAALAKHSRGYLTQVLIFDLDGDLLPEVSLAFSTAYSFEPSMGDTRLLLFQCIGGRYEAHTLFLRAGAGERSEGLFTGGGVRVLGVLDMNGNGLLDILFACMWGKRSDPGGEFYLIEWDGQQFRSLIEYEHWQNYTAVSIDSAPLNGFKVEDVNGDATLEMVFPYVYDSMLDEKISPAIYAWNGTTYEMFAP